MEYYNKNDNVWHKRFIDLARHVAQWSKDPSTKTGAVIVDDQNRVISTGYNGFPKGFDDAPERLSDREYKYKHIIHCEVNAILFAQRPLHNHILYTWPFMSCIRCATLVVQTGIKACYAPYNNNPRWIEDFKLTEALFRECGVELYVFPNMEVL